MQQSGHGEQRAPDRWERLSLGGGIAFVILVMAAIFSAPDLPGPEAPAAEYAASYAANRSGHLMSTYFTGLASMAFLIFLGGLFGTLHRARGGNGQLAHLAFGSGVATILLVLAAQAVYAAAALTAEAEGVAPGVVRGIDQLVPALMLFSDFPRVVFIAAAALAMLQARVAPRWVGGLGLVVALVNLIGTAAYFDLEGVLGLLGFLGTLLFTLWILVTSVALLLRNAAWRPASRAAVA